MAWSISGSYYESCNCDAVCPCRRLNGNPGQRSTHGFCQFVLSWRIRQGEAGGMRLDDLKVALAGFYYDDEPGEPWSIKLYIDERTDDCQFERLEDIYLGRSGGNMVFPTFFGTILECRRADIALSHKRGSESIMISGLGGAHVVRPAVYDGTVTCGIPGHDHVGQESVSSLHMGDAPLNWAYEERCGFAANFAYFG